MFNADVVFVHPVVFGWHGGLLCEYDPIIQEEQMDGELHGAMLLGCEFLTDNEELAKGLLEKKEFCHKETIDELYPGLIDAAVKARQEVEGADLVCETIFFIDKKVQARTSKAFGARGSNWYYLKGDKREVDAITKRLNELNVETVPLRETLIEAIAAACHQQNRIWCLAHHDESQSMWLDEPDWQRDSVIAGVKGALARGLAQAQARRGLELRTREERRDEDAPVHAALRRPARGAQDQGHLLHHDGPADREGARPALARVPYTNLIFAMLIAILGPWPRFKVHRVQLPPARPRCAGTHFDLGVVLQGRRKGRYPAGFA
jgi:hypothetical protein